MSIDELRQQKETLSDTQLLSAIATYFIITIPTHLDPDYVIEVEAIINKLYVRAYQAHYSSAILNDYIEAIGLISELSEKTSVKKHRDAKFFRMAKQFGQLLNKIAPLLD